MYTYIHDIHIYICNLFFLIMIYVYSNVSIRLICYWSEMSLEYKVSWLSIIFVFKSTYQLDLILSFSFSYLLFIIQICKPWNVCISDVIRWSRINSQSIEVKHNSYDSITVFSTCFFFFPIKLNKHTHIHIYLYIRWAQ